MNTEQEIIGIESAPDGSAVDPEITHLFVDMDGVLTDFTGSKNFKRIDKQMKHPPRMYEEGFFGNLSIIAPARWGVRVLLRNPKLKLHVLTKPVFNSAISYSEKVEWIGKYFPELLGNIIITHDKAFCSAPGRVLIDDSAVEWQTSWEANGGVFWHFNTDKAEEEWMKICLKYHPEYFNVEYL